jgi:cellulose synthase (UDP-forming)
MSETQIPTPIAPPEIVARPSRRVRLIQWIMDGPTGWADRVLGRKKAWVALGLVSMITLISLPLIITSITWQQQGLVAIIVMVLGWCVVNLEHNHDDPRASEALHLLIIWLSTLTTLRYLYYRTSYTLKLDTWVDGFFSILLYVAELYAILTLFLAYFQTLRIRDRIPVDLSKIPEDRLFSVDIYIPTYNEDVDIVRKTILGALAIDYPASKKRVYVLDDGRAEKYKARRQLLYDMCDELGATMMVRDNNDHAKAGNINTAMKKTPGDLVMILDCDHIPTRQFLQHTAGFFYNEKVALVQTPHWFYNPDPFERNLLTGGKVPVGNELFYKVLQKGNDFWNAAFFCGSAAVVRKKYVLQVGGIAVETVTEDCHTSFRLHSLGYESVYYDKVMVAGLAPEMFSSYVGQQVRWARGMAQILRLENPMFNRKLNLTIFQRICYFGATSHFFFGYPRLMYAIAPTLFLLFGINPIKGLGLETLAYALPHIILSTYANYIPYKNVRFSFWNEIYEFAMSFQAGIVTMMALINPSLGSFNVTDKGLTVTERNFDWESTKGLLIVAGLVVIALLAVPFLLINRPEDREAIWVNAFWGTFNLILMVSAILVAFEQPQLRTFHRLQRKLQVTIYAPGQILKGKTEDISESGCRLTVDSWTNLPDEIEIEIMGDFGARAILNAKIRRATPLNETQVELAVDFLELSQPQKDALAIVIYSDVREWYSQNREEVDDPWGSFRFIAMSLLRSFQDAQPASGVRLRKTVQTAVQLYWNREFLSGVATEIDSNGLRVELRTGATADSFAGLEPGKALIGLLLSHTENLDIPNRLLAIAERIEPIDGGVAVELRFPDKIMEQQRPKIRQWVKVLN